MVKILTLQDARLTDTDGAMSCRSLFEYDCSEGKTRIVSSSGYEKAMGKGRLINTDNELGDWLKVPPDTVGDSIRKVACTKK